MITQQQINRCYDELMFVRRLTQNLLDAEEYEAAYDWVFRAFNKMTTDPSEIVGYIKYYDPDTSYYEDTVAKLEQIDDYIRVLKPLVEKMENG